MDKRNYDLVVIGGGPAGITGAATAAGFGKSVALIDGHHELGGAGVNTVLHQAEHYERRLWRCLAGGRATSMGWISRSERKRLLPISFVTNGT